MNSGEDAEGGIATRGDRSSETAETIDDQK